MILIYYQTTYHLNYKYVLLTHNNKLYNWQYLIHDTYLSSSGKFGLTTWQIYE